MRRFHSVKQAPFPFCPALPWHCRDTGRACSHQLPQSSIAGGFCPGASPAWDMQRAEQDLSVSPMTGRTRTWLGHEAVSAPRISQNYSTETRSAPVSPRAAADQITSHTAILGEQSTLSPRAPELGVWGLAAEGRSRTCCSHMDHLQPTCTQGAGGSESPAGALPAT